MSNKTILAFSNHYKQKYFFDDSLGPIPEEVKKEVLVLLITLTEEAGGVAELSFDEFGEASIDSWAEEGDLGYDSVSARLLINEMERDQRTLFLQLNEWFEKIGSKHI